MTCNELNIVMHVLKKKKLTITVSAENTMHMHQDLNKTAPAQTKIATLFSAYLCFSLAGIISVSMGKESRTCKHNSYVKQELPLLCESALCKQNKNLNNF